MTSLPMSRIPDPGDAPALRWGVIGPGNIANSMAQAMRKLTRQRIVAVASRAQERAQAFADSVGAEKAYDDVAALVADPDVDVVYVASTHNAHHAHAMAALEAGKPVLVEKAFTLNAGQARDIQEAAQKAGVLAVEAMWPRFGPRFDIVRQLLADGAIGDVRFVLADHSQAIAHIERMMRPELAGGAMLDLGVYPVSFASFVLGRPASIHATGTLTDTGVDESVAISLQSAADEHALASLSTTLAGRGINSAAIIGSEGRIELGGTSFYAPGTVRVVATPGEVRETAAPGFGGNDGLAHEAAHIARLVAEGATDSPLMPIAESVEIMETIDEIRRQVGVVYPEER